MVWNEQVKRVIPVEWEVKTLSQIMQKNSKPFDYSSVQTAVDLSIMPSNSIAITQLNSSENFATNLFEMKKGDILFGSIRLNNTVRRSRLSGVARATCPD